MPIATEGLPLYLAIILSFSGPISTVATSFNLITPIFSFFNAFAREELKIIFSNSNGVVKSVAAITENSLPRVSILPAGISKFCYLIAFSTSCTVRLYAVNLLSSSQTLIEYFLSPKILTSAAPGKD